MLFFWLGTLPMMAAVGAGAQRMFGAFQRRLPLVSAGAAVLLGLLSMAGKIAVRPPSTHTCSASFRQIDDRRRYARSGVSVAADTSCAHCMLPVPSGLIEAAEERQFCCTGCRTAFAMIAEHGLGAYYDIRGATRWTRRDERPQLTRSSITPRSVSFTFERRRTVASGRAVSGRCTLRRVRVARRACTTLVPGVARAELDVRRSLARIVWHERDSPTLHIARALDSLGYGRTRSAASRSTRCGVARIARC